MSLKHLEARDSVKKARAKELLKDRVRKGAEQQQALIEQIAQTVIVDRLVDPRSMRFFHSTEDHTVKLEYGGDNHNTRFIHSHALGQLASVAGIPRVYVNALLVGKEWKKELLAHNFNELFHKGTYLDRRKNQAKFLHRLVGNELRGFLSRNYNRKLLTAPLLRSYIESCAAYEAAPVEALTTAVRSILKCMTPFVFEPVDGEFVSFGITFSNSDFGAGRTKVSGTLMRISSGTISVLEDRFSRVHLSSIIEESDIEMSDETSDKELAAHKSAIRDAVASQLSEASVDRMLKMIQMAHENNIPWYKLKDKLTKVLIKKDIEFVEQLLKEPASGGVIDLPPVGMSSDGEKMATGWWTANVLGWMANREEDVDKRQDLQQLAGEVLGG